jgi:hypothetical protein
MISMFSWRLPAAKNTRRSPVNKVLKFAIMLSAATFALSLPAFAGVGSCAPAAVPEPITLTLLATGIGAVAVMRKLRDK